MDTEKEIETIKWLRVLRAKVVAANKFIKRYENDSGSQLTEIVSDFYKEWKEAEKMDDAKSD